jgi:hypothetical protein
MNQLKIFLQTKPLFVLLLPFFFVFHGFTEYFFVIPLTDAFYLFVLYAAAALILFFLGWLFVKKKIKAALFSFCILAFHFFFGGLQDLLKNVFNDALVTRYSFLLPFFFVLLMVFIIWLKKRKKDLFKLSFYLNCLLCLLIIIDLAWLVQKSVSRTSSSVRSADQAVLCDSCVKPDIYFLLFDEYSSSSALKELWNYDNNDLDSFLTGKGFSIQPFAKSNYNFTQFSVASTLNMEYLNIPDPKACTIKDYNKHFELIKKNRVCSFLKSNGYDIVNYSIFDLDKSPSPVTENMLPLKTKLITSQTFLSRLRRDLYYHLLVGRFAIPWLTKDLIYFTFRTNNKIIDATLKESQKNSPTPRFVYSHIKMPHPPFYYNRLGLQTNKIALLTENEQRNPRPYLEYIPKTNEVIEQLVNTIISTAKRPVAIILIADHGFRTTQPEDYYFRIQNAVYCSYKPLNGFYPDMTSVNQFRLLFNNLFGTNYPLLKDSSIFLIDK